VSCEIVIGILEFETCFGTTFELPGSENFLAKQVRSYYYRRRAIDEEPKVSDIFALRKIFQQQRAEETDSHE
jgi:hypothetical protein